MQDSDPHHILQQLTQTIKSIHDTTTNIPNGNTLVDERTTVQNIATQYAHLLTQDIQNTIDELQLHEGKISTTSLEKITKACTKESPYCNPGTLQAIHGYLDQGATEQHCGLQTKTRKLLDHSMQETNPEIDAQVKQAVKSIIARRQEHPDEDIIANDFNFYAKNPNKDQKAAIEMVHTTFVKNMQPLLNDLKTLTLSPSSAPNHHQQDGCPPP